MQEYFEQSTAFFTGRVGMMIVCCLFFVTIQARADVNITCAGVSAPAPCGITITISGSSGHLVATIANPGESYDGEDDQIVGIINNSSVAVGAIRLSSGAPAQEEDNLFQFDGDGPACYFGGYEGQCPISDPTDYQGPDNTFVGISTDYTTGTILFTVPLAPNGGSTWSGMENTPAAVVSVGETQQLVTGVANVFPFGPFTCTSDGCSPGSGTWSESGGEDDFQFTPIAGVTGADYWTFLPIPVCAGPAGESPFGPFTGSPSFGFTTGDFGLEAPSNCPTYGPSAFVTNFGPLPAGGFGTLPFPNQNSLACVPYLDYSSLNAPVCVELERDCSGPDCTNPALKWTAKLDYDLDNNSIAGPIGGPAILFAPGVPGPTSPGVTLPYAAGPTDFSINAITAYTGANPGVDPPPAKAGGSDGKSVFVSAFSPEQSETSPIPPGVTVGFPGFEVPASNTSTPSCSPESAQYLLFPSGKQVTVNGLPVNCLVKLFGVPVPVPLIWDYTTTSGTPIKNLNFCPSVSVDGTCPGVNPPWVHLSLIPVAGCGASFTGQNPLLGPLSKLAANFANLGGGQYTFVWEPGNNTVNTPKGCTVSPVLQFDNGTFASPAVFVYSY